MALGAHQVAPAQPLIKGLRHRQTGGPGALVVNPQPDQHPVLRPAQEGVLEQADRVVADRPEHRILEIDHPRVGVADHQVARHEVAVHEHSRLGQGGLDQGFAIGARNQGLRGDVKAKAPKLAAAGQVGQGLAPAASSSLRTARRSLSSTVMTRRSLWWT